MCELFILYLRISDSSSPSHGFSKLHITLIHFFIVCNCVCVCVCACMRVYACVFHLVVFSLKSTSLIL